MQLRVQVQYIPLTGLLAGLPLSVDIFTAALAAGVCDTCWHWTTHRLKSQAKWRLQCSNTNTM